MFLTFFDLLRPSGLVPIVLVWLGYASEELPVSLGYFYEKKKVLYWSIGWVARTNAFEVVFRMMMDDVEIHH